MSHTVFVLGAGASVCAGAPLMREFLDRARDVLPRATGPDRHTLDGVLRGMGELQAAQSKGTLDLVNIETVFAAFEMARLFEQLGSLTPHEITGLRSNMSRLITRTLDETVRFPVMDIGSRRTHEVTWEIGQRQVTPPTPYRDFGRLVRHLRLRGHSVAVMTFNYDIAADYALTFNESKVDYCLDPPPPVDQGAVPLLKLHGSVNWGRCANCSDIVPLPIDRHVINALSEQADVRAVSAITVPIGNRLTSLSHCGRACELEPMIVPPTWNKERYYEEIRRLWRRAASELRDAENVFVIGYSWPETDYFFHHLYALGTVGPTLLRRFWLIDDSDDTNQRYHKLLGQQSLQRFDCKGCKFEDVLPHFINEFKIDKFYDS